MASATILQYGGTDLDHLADKIQYHRSVAVIYRLETADIATLQFHEKDFVRLVFDGFEHLHQ